jgi:hypothetical protein
MIFIATEHCCQFQLISPSGTVFGKRKIYYTSEAALKAGLEWIAWGSEKKQVDFLTLSELLQVDLLALSKLLGNTKV